MSTIDIGIAEAPAPAAARTNAMASPARLPPAQARVHPSVTMPPASSDFYVGSIKIEALASTGQTAQTLQQ